MTTVDAITRHLGHGRAWVLFKNGLLRILPRGQSLPKEELITSARKSIRSVLSSLQSHERYVDEWQHETLTTGQVELFYLPHSNELAMAATPSKKSTAAQQAQAELDALWADECKHLPEPIAFGATRAAETKETHPADTERQLVTAHFGDKGASYYYFASHHMVVGPASTASEATRLLADDARRAALGVKSVYALPEAAGRGELYCWKPFLSLGVYAVTVAATVALARSQLHENYTNWTLSSDRPVPVLVAAPSQTETKTSSSLGAAPTRLQRAYRVSKRSDADTNVTVFTDQGKEHAKCVGKEALGCKKVDVERMPSLRISVVLGAHVISACSEDEDEGKESGSDSD